MNTTATNQTVKAVVSWVITLWICRVFLTSLPYKFTGHPDTRHIFGTIGEWMNGVFGDVIGEWFIAYGAYVVGAFELLTSGVLLLPALLWVGAKISGDWHGPSRARPPRLRRFDGGGGDDRRGVFPPVHPARRGSFAPGAKATAARCSTPRSPSSCSASRCSSLTSCIHGARAERDRRADASHFSVAGRR